MDCLVDLELTVSKEKEDTPVIEEFLEMPLKEHLVLQDLSVRLEKKVEMPILEGLEPLVPEVLRVLQGDSVPCVLQEKMETKEALAMMV
jgi:hypothetical protein